MDVLTAFFNSDVEEEIFTQVPQELEVPEEFHEGRHALRLLKGLNGLKQSPRLLRNSTCKILNLARLLLLLILKKIAFQRENIYPRRILKDVRASLDL
jgi:hypothetical protein